MPILKRTDVELHYELEGSGPRVVFIQGVGVVGGGWGPQVDVLSKRFTTLVIDNRGIGKSQPCTGPITIATMVDDVRAVMDDLGWSSAHVVGHSMGGVIAQQLALDFPKRVNSLALLCTFARGKEGARVTPRIMWLGIRTRVGTRAMRRRAFLEILVPDHRLAGADSARLAGEFAPLIGRDLADSPPILMKQLKALGSHDCSERLKELASIPTLILSAEHDPIALPEYGRRLAELIPNSQFEELEDMSHGVVIERPELVNERLSSFWR